MRRSKSAIGAALAAIGVGAIIAAGSLGLAAYGGVTHGGPASSSRGSRPIACSARQLIVGKATYEPGPAAAGFVAMSVEQPVWNIGASCIFHIPDTIVIANAKGARERVHVELPWNGVGGYITSRRVPRHGRKSITLWRAWPIDLFSCKGEIRNVSKVAIPLKGGYLRISNFGGASWGEVCKDWAITMDVVS